jgi:hypothetical protein
MDYHIPLIADKTYHIFNRAVGSDKLFHCNRDHLKFLDKYEYHINPIADTFSFNLLPNHFHFQIQIKSYNELLELFCKKNPGKDPEVGWQPKFVIKQFSNMLNGYAKWYNRKYDRKGSLFIDYLRRVEIMDDIQFTNTLFYVHKNPVHHGYCDKIEDWLWSSYNELLANTHTNLQRQKVLEWFGNREKFIEFHQRPIPLKNVNLGIDL